MVSYTRLVGRILMILIVMVVTIFLGYSGFAPPCRPAALFMLLGMALVMGLFVFLAFLDKLCTVRVSVKRNVVRIGLGICGSIDVPLENIVGARIVDKARPVIRLGGTAVPGVFYSGYYEVKDVGRAYIFSERLDNLVELRLVDGSVIYVGGDAPSKLKDIVLLARAPTDKQSKPGFRTSISNTIAQMLLVASIAYILLGIIIYPFIPNRVPTHFTSHWRPDSWGPKWEALAAYYVIGGIGVALATTYKLIARKDPVAAVLTLPVVAGIFLIGIGSIIMYIGCNWWLAMR